MCLSSMADLWGLGFKKKYIHWDVFWLQVKVESDEDELRRRQAQAQERTPAQLAQMASVADLPVPSALQNIFAPARKKRKGGQQEGEEGEEVDGADGRR